MLKKTWFQLQIRMCAKVEPNLYIMLLESTYVNAKTLHDRAPWSATETSQFTSSTTLQCEHDPRVPIGICRREQFITETAVLA